MAGCVKCATCCQSHADTVYDVGAFLCTSWLGYGLLACGIYIETNHVTAEAREDYLNSAAGFQAAKGFRGRRGSTTMRLDGVPSSSECSCTNMIVEV